VRESSNVGTRDSFRVLVTGSRSTSPQEARYVHKILQDVHVADILKNGHREMVVIQGECPYGGVDREAKLWAEDGRVAVHSEGYPADWDRHGKAAGPIRNAYMVSLGADLCVAFPAATSRGTWDCIRRASGAGIPVHIWPLPRDRQDRPGGARASELPR
jgi:hypothetical protein